jgi:hypothetical protein
VKVAFIKNEKDAVAELTSGDEENKPALIVFDLNNVNAKPMTLIPKLKAKLKKTVSIVGFLSHLQGDLKAKAVEAGCDAVMPRAAFSQNLPNLLRRYSVEEGEEVKRGVDSGGGRRRNRHQARRRLLSESEGYLRERRRAELLINPGTVRLGHTGREAFKTGVKGGGSSDRARRSRLPLPART